MIARCSTLDGAAPGDGAFAPGPAVWVGRREAAHVDADGRVDVRLTRPAIRARRAALRADDRITLRAAGSDWLTVTVTRESDWHRAVGLITEAVRRQPADRTTRPTAHRPGPRPAPKAPLTRVLGAPEGGLCCLVHHASPHRLVA